MPTQLTTGDLVTAANWNTIPGGVLGYAQVTADQTGITSTTDLTGLSVTVNVAANRRIMITGSLEFAAQTASVVANMLIYQDTAQLQRANVSIAAGIAVEVQKSVVITPASGSFTFKLRANRESGTGSLRTEQDTDRPAFILVEDLGPA